MKKTITKASKSGALSGMSDADLMKALQRAKPKKHGDRPAKQTPTPQKKTGSVPALVDDNEVTPESIKERKKRNVRELSASAGCEYGATDCVDRILLKATAVKNVELANRLIAQVAKLPKAVKMSGDEIDGYFSDVALLMELNPENVTQALLAIQMIGVHEAGLAFTKRAFLDGQTTESIDSNVRRANALMNLFLRQIEAMQKLKGLTGQSKVVVEHVNVGPGGQAIVGAFEAAKLGDGGGGQNAK